MEVSLYSSPTCGYCHQAERFLTERGVRFTKYDISVDRAAANKVHQMTGQMAVPVIVVDGQVVVGFDRPRLEQLLANSRKRGRPAFGLRVSDAERCTKAKGVPLPGAYVDKVATGYPGDKAGLREGDIITEINYHPVRNAVELAETIASLSAGSDVEIGLVRGESQLVSHVSI